MTNQCKLFHKLSHSYMFRHYRVILREPVINVLPSYTSISNAVYNSDVSHRFYAISHYCLFRGFIMLIFQRLQYHNLHKTCVKRLNCKLYYRQLHLKYWCNLARYWLQAPWGRHDSVETCRSVIICEIIVHLLLNAQNSKRCAVQVLK